MTIPLSMHAYVQKRHSMPDVNDVFVVRCEDLPSQLRPIIAEHIITVSREHCITRLPNDMHA